MQRQSKSYLHFPLQTSPILLCYRFLVLFLSLSLHGTSISLASHGSSNALSLYGQLAEIRVSFPVYHSSYGSKGPHIDDQNIQLIDRHARRTLTLPDNTTSSPSAPSPSSTNVLPELRSELVTLSEPLGQYFALIQIGTPAKDVAVIIDSGSELMWIQCQPCVQCGPQVEEYPIFDPAQSSSFKNVACDVVNGLCPFGDDSVATGCNNGGSCVYTVTYGDDSNSTGVLAQETLTLSMAGGPATAAATKNSGSKTFQLTEFVFGCGVDNEGVETRFNSSGLMGLDRGPFSIITQFSVGVFSYCLPNRANGAVDVSGYLTFASSASSSSSSLQYTPLLQNENSTFSLQFYYLGLTGITVNGNLLTIPAAAFELNNDTGTGGTIIDSGTTFTGFVDEAYTVVVAALESAMAGSSMKKVDSQEFNSTTKVCYEVPAGLQPTAPKLGLRFEGSVEMELGADQVLYLAATDSTGNNYYCLALSKAGSIASGAKNVIGNYQQQDFVVEYDIAKSRLGFAPTQCSSISSTRSHGGLSSLATAGVLLPWLLSMLLHVTIVSILSF